jgi:tellurite resistance protein
MNLFGEIARRIGGSKAVASIGANLTKQDDLARACALMASVAYADGNADENEVEVLTNLAQDMFPTFTPKVVEEAVAVALGSHKTAVQMGFLRTKRLLGEVESNEEKESIFTAGFVTAARSGGVGADEYKLLKRYADQCRFDLKSIGLEGPDPA